MTNKLIYTEGLKLKSIFPDLLSQLNPGLDLKTCSVFVKPTSPLVVHHIEHKATQLPLTSTANHSYFPVSIFLVAILSSLFVTNL